MKDKLQRQIERLTRAHKRHSRWQRLVAVLAGVVALCTLGVLMMPAVAMEGEPRCGKAEHTHTDACYTQVLTCGQEEGDSHTHMEACYTRELTCGQAEHTHTDACYRDAAESAATPEPETTAEPTETPAAGEPETTAEPTATPEPTVTPTATPAPTVTPVPSATPNQTEGQEDDNEDNADNATVFAVERAADGVIASDPIPGVTLTINDEVSDSGCYEAAVTDVEGALEGKSVWYQWYKRTDGADYTPVEAKTFTVGGKTVSNIRGKHGEKLFLALDGGTVSDTLPSVTYKAVLKVDGTEYDSVSADLTNITYQASVLNGSFEAPNLTDDKYHYQQFVREGTPGLFWKTTASNEEEGMPAYPDGLTKKNDGEHYIEIIDTGTDKHKSDAANLHQQNTPTDGTQYAEINAGAAGALYQTIATIPGTTMYWSVDHSGRNGTDIMAVVMMPESTAENITTQAQLREVLKNPSVYGATVASDLSAEKGVWTTHSGQYTIPEKQYETRFFFMAVSTHDNNDFVGNHIDNVWFSQQIPPASAEKPYFTLTKHVVGPLTEDDLRLLSGKLTFTVQKSHDSNFTNPETVKTYTATNLGSWTPNDDGSWTLSARIPMQDQAFGDYYKIVESGAELEGFKLTVTDANAAVQLQSTTTGAEFTFTNTYTSIVVLPETGGIGTWPFMAAGLLLIGTALALLLKKRKTNN